MKKLLIISTLALAVVSCCKAPEGKLTDFVNPLIGTTFTGHTYPGATTPFAMVQLSPDNGILGWKFCSGYHMDSHSILGFSHTHLSGTGASDMGDILFMPVVGEVPFITGSEENPDEGFRSRFSNDSEIARPGYYRVYLDDYKVNVELTASPRVGVHRYTFPQSEDAGVMIDLEHGLADKPIESFIKVEDAQTIVGMRRSTGFVKDHVYYFCAKFSKPIEGVESYKDGELSDATDISGVATKMRVKFTTAQDEKVTVKVALSTASTEGAAKNLEAEVAAKDFDIVYSEADALWNSYLSRVEIEPRNEDQRVSFYTSLYHSLLMPNMVTDLDGSYSGWDHQLHVSEAGDMYTNFSLWDTYRAQHPFLELVYPECNSHFVRSLLERFRQTGLLVTNEYGMCETWCMIGNHAVPVIADAFLKGDKSFDAQEAYEAVKTSMTMDHNKSEWTEYNRYGYFPYDVTSVESVSRTMEACYDDYCIALMAKALGKDEDYDFFIKRAENFKNLYSEQDGLVRGLSSKGTWHSPFNPFALTSEAGGGDFTEGNAWQWTWHVQHDPQGLFDMLGGKERFVEKLDTLFTMDFESLPGHDLVPDVTGMVGLYSQGNEPSHHIAYLYNLAGRGDRTAEIIRTIFDQYYKAKRDGLCGNDDCGQMSAWYMFSAMGFYPVDPVGGSYVVGAPQMPKVTVHLPSGKDFTVTAGGLSDTNKYIGTMLLNGSEKEPLTISYDEIRDGGTLDFTMTDKAI